MSTRRIASAFLALVMTVSLMLGMVPTAMAATATSTLKLWYDEPASGTSNTTDSNGIWQSATLPIGNGRIGANVYGELSQEHLTLNEETLWSGGRGSVSNYDGGNVSHSDSDWSTWVSAVKSGSFNAENMAGDSSSSSGYYNGYQALGDIYFAFSSAPSSAPSDYVRELNLESGVSSVSYTYNGVAYTREYFVADDPNVLVARFTANGGTMSFTATLSSKQSASPSYSTTNGMGYINCAGTVSNNGLMHNTQVYIVPDNGTVSSGTSGVTVSGATSVTVYLSAGTDYATTYSSGSTSWYYRTGETAANLKSSVKAELDTAVSEGYATVAAAYASYYTGLFGKVSVDLGQSNSKTTDALLSGYSSATTAEKRYLEVLQYQYGRYLLISGSSQKSQLPTTLQGIWNNNNSAPWYSDIHTNINLEMNYWLSGTGNLAECLKPLVSYMEAMYEPGNYTVQAYTDADTGMMMHTQNTPFGYTSPGWSISTWGWSPSASTWLLQNCYDYYEYSQDADYLKNTIFPLLVKQCEMYRQLLEIGDSGKYVFPIAYSPEHGSVTYGNTYEQSIIWQLFEDTIEAAYDLGYSSSDVVYSAKSLKLSDIEYIFANLKGIETGSNSIGSYIKEWYTESYYGQYGESSHRHISQLLGAYPGNMLTTDALKTAAANTLTLRGANTVSGWSLAQRACTWAAVGNGDNAYTYLKYVLTNGVMQNLWGYHSYGSYGGENKAFQIDANYGYSAAFNEMLLQSNYGYIDLIPAIPSAWNSGSFYGLLAEGNFEVDAQWSDSAVTKAVVTSNKGGSCSIAWAPAGENILFVTDSTGASVSYTEANGIYTFSTVAGRSYTVTEGEVPPVSYTYTLGEFTVSSSRSSLTAAEISWTAPAVSPANSSAEILYTLEKSVSGVSTAVLTDSAATSYTDSDASESAVYTVTANLYLNGEAAAAPVSASASLSGSNMPAFVNGTITLDSAGGSGTTYVLDTDGIDSAVYALVIYNTNNESSGSNYYVVSTDMKSSASPYGLITTVVTDYLSSDKTTADLSSLTSRSYLWNVTANNGVYTISAVDGSGTISVNGQSNLNLSGSNTTLYATAGNRTNAYYVGYNGTNGYRLDMYSDRDGYKPTNGQCLLSAWSTGGTSAHNNVYFYKQIVDESEAAYTADASSLLTLIAFAQSVDQSYYSNWNALGMDALISAAQTASAVTAGTDSTTAETEQTAVNEAGAALHSALLQLSTEAVYYGYVTVNYVDDAGNTLKASETITGVTGESYTVTAAAIANYDTPASVSGTYGKETTVTVNMVYVLNTDKTALKAALDAAVEQGDYTDESYASYTAAIAAGQTVYDKARAMQTEVDAAVTAINEAKASFAVQVYYGYVTVNYVDDAGNTLKNSESITGVTGESYTVTASAIANYDTPASVSGTYGKETTVTVNMVYVLNTDKTALAALLNNVVEKGDYTDESYASYTAAITAGQTVYDKARAMQTEVNAAVTAINEAKANLVIQVYYGYVTVNYVDDAGNTLKASETLTGEFGTDYTVTAAAIANYDTPASVSGTYGKETTVTVNMVYVLNTDKTALAALLNNVVEQGDYTDESYAAYTAAIAAGQVVYDTTRAMQTEVDAAVAAINTAKGNLVVSCVSVSPDSVSVSSSVSSYSTYYAANAVDGNTSTYYWASSAQASGATFTVDFGGYYTIDGVSVVSNYYNDYIRSAVVQYSVDGKTWIDMGSIAGDGTATPMTVSTEDYVDARYVRVKLTESSNYWWILNEITFSWGPASTYEPPVSTVPVFNLDTDGINSSGEYLIKSYSSDTVIAIVNGSITAVSVDESDGAVSLDDETCVWIFTTSGSGYTIKNKATGQYLSYARSGSSGGLTLSTTSRVWYVSDSGSYVRLYTLGTRSYYYLRYYSSAFSLSTTSSSSYNYLQLYLG